MKILLVEDDPIIRMLITSQLSSKGNYVITAKNGVDAMGILAENPNVEVIVTDIMMPEMDGVELASRLLETPFKNIPVLAITGGTYLEDNDGNPTPFMDVLQKPIYIQDLISQIDTIIQLKKNKN